MAIISFDPSRVRLSEWNVIVIRPPYSSRYMEVFIGFSLSDELGRVSTTIKSFDENDGRGETLSGSIYELVGRPTLPHTDALYVFEQMAGKKTYDAVLNGKDKNIYFKYAVGAEK